MVKRLLLIFTLLAGFTLIADAQSMNTAVNTRAKFKSLFIYKFAQSIEWPAAYKQGDFVIGIVGDEPLAKNLEMAAKTKSINSQKVIVKRFSNVSEVTKCHAIYISGKTAGEVEPYVQKAKEYSCLIITEAPGMLDRLAAINFIVVGNQIRYEMNRKLFRDQSLVVSNSLENLASRVIN